MKHTSFVAISCAATVIILPPLPVLPPSLLPQSLPPLLEPLREDNELDTMMMLRLDTRKGFVGRGDDCVSVCSGYSACGTSRILLVERNLRAGGSHKIATHQETAAGCSIHIRFTLIELKRSYPQIKFSSTATLPYDRRCSV